MATVGLPAAAALVVIALLVELYLRHLLTRPFYYDEAWRAYEVSLGRTFLSRLSGAPAPIAFGWWALEVVARHVFGSTEAGLRTPMFALLPVLGVATYALARAWLNRPASAVVAGLLLVNGWIVNYALQLKAYSFEALMAVAGLGIFLLAQRTTWRPSRLLALYAALGITCVFSLPSVFVVGPLLVLDLYRTVRGRGPAVTRVAGVALAGAIALVHYMVFVRPQAGVVEQPFFQSRFAPGQPGAMATFIWHGLASYVPSMVIGVEGGALSAAPVYHLAAPAAGLLSAVLIVLLVAGIGTAARNAAGRALVAAVGGILLLELVASALHRWPFGLLRVNIFVLPLLYVLAGIGAARLAWLLRGLVRSGRGTPAAWRAGVGPASAAAALTVTAAAVLVAAVVTGFATTGTMAATKTLSTKPAWWAGTKAGVAAVRLGSSPGDLVLIRADRAVPEWYAYPWLYYMDGYRGYPATVAARGRIPDSRSSAATFITDAAVGHFLDAHPAAPTVFLVEYDGPGGAFPSSTHDQSLGTMRRFGYCPVRAIPMAYTGAVTIMSKRACRAS